MTLSELSQFNLDLDEGEALLTQVTCRKAIHLMLLLQAPERSKKLPQQLGITHRSLNYYRSGERVPKLDKAIEIYNTLGYDLVLRKRQ